jgi:hypothetical protein
MGKIADFFMGNTAAGVVKAGAGAVGKGVSNILDRWWPKKLSELERLTAYSEALSISEASTDSAREMFMTELRTQKQPWVIRFLNGLVRPLGGLGALGIEFFNILAPNLAVWLELPLTRITITVPEHLVLASIIAFYFGSRLKETLGGMATKR